MNSERWRGGVARAPPGPDRGRSNRARRPAAAATRRSSARCRCAGVRRRRRARARRGSLDARARERAAADLDDQPVEVGPPAEPATISQPSVSPPSMARPLRLPWQVNGSAPRPAPRASRRTVGSPATPGVRGQTATRAPSSLEPLEHRRVGVGRDEHARAALARRRRRRRRPAPRCRSSRWPGRGARPGRCRPSRSTTSRCSEHAEQVPGLVRAGDVAGLVLDPDAAGRGEAERAR